MKRRPELVPRTGAFAATRIRKQGNQKDRMTGNLVAAAFVHDSSRALDSQLHTHAAVPLLYRG